MAVEDHNYESFFSYNVSRNYPYRWFTPTAVIGGLICTVLFSILNFAANSYDLVTHTTNDLNSTIAGPSSLRRWPLYFRGKVQPTCEPATIAVGSQLFTNQTALTYRLDAIWRTSSDGANTTILSSMPYSSNVIENCSVTAIGMDLAALDRSPSQLLFTGWGCVAKTFIMCAFDSLDGVINVNLTQSYELIPPLVYWGPGYSRSAFLDSDNQTRASLWWGESAMANYWMALVGELGHISYNVTQSGSPAIRKGSIYFFPNGSTTDIKDLGFFNMNYGFIVDEGLGNYTNNISTTQTTAELNQARTYPDIWIFADSLAKSLYSVVLTDLGQTQAKSNFLVNADDLEYFTNNFTYMLNSVDDTTPGPVAEVDFDSAKNETGPLGTTPSVFSTQYICQVPQLKSTGNIFISILVADLVFLQTTWTIFTFVVGVYLSRTTQRNSNNANIEGYQNVEVTAEK